MAIIPSIFPIVFERGEYQVSPEDTRVLTEMEDGSIYARQISTAAFTDINVKWILKDAEFVKFREWFAEDTQYGVQSFLLKVPVGFELCTATTTRMCFFKESPPWVATRQSPNLWYVTAKLRVKDW